MACGSLLAPTGLRWLIDFLRVTRSHRAYTAASN